jgi:hypothetical protein
MTNLKNKSITIFGILVLLIIISAGLFIISQRNSQFAVKRKEPARPVTIENVVLRIESNIMRTQAEMEQLVFSEYASDLNKKVEAINLLNEAIHTDLEAMGKHFLKGNTQYQNVLALFQEWKTIKENIIKLTTEGASASAKKIVRGKSAAHATEIRTALTALNNFSKQRADDFNSAALKKY